MLTASPSQGSHPDRDGFDAAGGGSAGSTHRRPRQAEAEYSDRATVTRLTIHYPLGVVARDKSGRLSVLATTLKVPAN